MYRCVVAPVDGSPFGEHALPLAISIAGRCRAVLHLTHVHVPLVAPPGVEAVTFPGAWNDATREQGRQYLAELKARIASGHRLRVETSLIEGPVADAVARHARRCGAGLVVMSTHAHMRLRRLWHQGVAEHVARELPVPVLMVHPRTGSEAPELTRAGRIRHILVPLDGSAFAEAMIPHAVQLADPFGASFTLFRVVKPEVRIGYSLLGQDGHVDHHRLELDRAAATLHLDATAATLRARGIRVRSRVDVSEDPASAIVEFARRSRTSPDPVDIIAMETHPHGTLARMLGAHTADEVIHDSPVPVLVFEPVPGMIPAAETATATAGATI
jgi:nucleotide-binding universal stress UspA family protein